MKKTRIRFFKFSDGKQNLQFIGLTYCCNAGWQKWMNDWTNLDNTNINNNLLPSRHVPTKPPNNIKAQLNYQFSYLYKSNHIHL